MALPYRAAVRALVATCACIAALCAAPLAHAQVAIWELTAPSGYTAYLMGSVHLLPGDTQWQSKQLRRYVRDSEALFLEAEMTSSASAKVRNYALAFGFSQIPDTALTSLASRKMLKRLRIVERQLDLPRGVFDKMRPWYAALNLSAAQVMAYGLKVSNGVEAWLNEEFDKRGRPTLGLEPPEAGLAAMARQGTDEQLELLAETIGQIESGTGDPRELVACWEVGDLPCLEQLVFSEMEPDHVFREHVLVGRNRAWVPHVLDALATPQTEFIAVGAAHLIGPDNLRTMLEEQGVRVERLQ